NRGTSPAKGDARFAAVEEFAREQELRRGRPGRIRVDDPARMRVVVGLFGTPEAADAESEQAAAAGRREANAASDALCGVVVFRRILGGLVLPAVEEPGDHV